MHKLALVFFVLSVGCVESTGVGKDPVMGSGEVPRGGAGDFSTQTSRLEHRTPVAREPESRVVPIRHVEFVECWQCRR